MDSKYRQVAEKAITLLVEFFSQDNFSELSLLLFDGELRNVLHFVGLATCEQIFQRRVNQAVSQARKPGLHVHSRPKTSLSTLYGRIKFESPYLYNRQNGESCKPAAQLLDLTGCGRTLALERAMVDFGIEESFTQASNRMNEHYGWTPEASAIRRVTLEKARQAEAYIDERLQEAELDYQQPLIDRPGVDEVLAELDGCQIRTGVLEKVPGRAKTKVRKLQKKRRKEKWREVRTGLIKKLGDVKKKYVSRMAKYPELAKMLFQLAVSEGLSEWTQVVGVADGGQGMKEELESWFAELQFILDHWHFKGHLYETADAKGLIDDERERWVTRVLKKVSKGRALEVIENLRSEHEVDGVERVLQLSNYLERFKDCVHYNEYKEEGWPIGSGEVESSHRYIPQKRLKLPGAWWHPENVNPMLALRVVRANEWWSEFWFQVETPLRLNESHDHNYL